MVKTVGWVANVKEELPVVSIFRLSSSVLRPFHICVYNRIGELPSPGLKR